jgi:von Willebrand factor type A domain
MKKSAGVLLTCCATLAVLSFACLACDSAAANETSKNVVIVLDDSGSMNKIMGRDNRSRMVVAKQAMDRLIDSLSDDTRLGIVLLNGSKDNGGWILPLGALDKQQARSTVASLRADGGTPLGSVMYRAMAELLKQREQLPYGDFRLVVITDGEATDAPVLKANLPKIISKGVLLDVIGVDMQSDHSLVQRSHSYRRANDAASFEKALKEIFAESSFDANDGNDGFEVLAALPDGLAEQALVALREGGNSMESQAANGPSSAANVQVAVPAAGQGANTGTNPANNIIANSPNPPTQSNNQARPVQQENSKVSGKFFLAIVIMLIIVLFKGLSSNIKRR